MSDDLNEPWRKYAQLNQGVLDAIASELHISREAAIGLLLVERLGGMISQIESLEKTMSRGAVMEIKTKNEWGGEEVVQRVSVNRQVEGGS